MSSNKACARSEFVDMLCKSWLPSTRCILPFNLFRIFSHCCIPAKQKSPK